MPVIGSTEGERGRMKPRCTGICLPLVLLLFARDSNPDDLLTQRGDNGRTGSIHQANFNQSLFTAEHNWGLRGMLQVNGAVYAQPLFVTGVPGDGGNAARNRVFVATEKNQIYSFDADSLQQIWTTSFGRNDGSDVYGNGGCDNLSPDGIGIESTPVIDPSRNQMFISYRTNQSTTPTTAQQRFVALDLDTGTPIKDVMVSTPGFDPVYERSRASLLLSGGVIYIAFGSRCEDENQPIFHGYLLAYDEATLTQVGVFAATAATFDGAGIWQASMGISSDDSGNIFFSTGNRRANIDRQPLASPTLADSFIDLVVERETSDQPPGYRLSMTPKVLFSPYRHYWLDATDLDLGSSGLVLIPGTHFGMGGGKQGMLYLFDRTQFLGVDQAHEWNAAQVETALRGTYVDFPEDFGADKMTQKFQAAVNEYYASPQAGGPVASVRHDTDAEELFGVGNNGAVWTTCETNDGPWSATAQITAPDFAPPGASVAVVVRGAAQVDVFVTGSNGATYTFARPLSVACNAQNATWAGPYQLTPVNFAPPGAAVSAVMRNEIQEDLFVVDQNGIVETLAVLNEGSWSQPIPLTPAKCAPAGGVLSSVARNANQEDVFFVDRNGAVETLSVSGTQAWQKPIVLTANGLAMPGQNIVSTARNANEEDVFLVDQRGIVEALVVNGEGPWSAPIAISASGLISPGAELSVATRNAKQQDLFVVDKGGAVDVLSRLNQGVWTYPAKLTPGGFLPTVGGVSSVVRSSVQEDVMGVESGGHPWTSAETNNQAAWTVPYYITTGLPMNDWIPWPHIHGSPVYAPFEGGPMIYLWPEKDHLKGYHWLGNSIDNANRLYGTGLDGTIAIAPPSTATLPGMPGGLLSAVIDSNQPGRGVLFASLSRTPDTRGPGILRAFDPLTMKELWNNQSDNYIFAKFVPPAVTISRVFLATCSNEVLVYGPAQ